MKDVEVYIGTDIRGRKRGTGRAIYLMRTRKADGTLYESIPQITELQDATEDKITLYALRDAIGRLNYGCKVIVYTEDWHIAAALNQGWALGWRNNGWINAKGTQVPNADLWEQILQDTDEAGHEFSAVAGEHEWTKWIGWKLQTEKTLNGVFKNVSDSQQI